MENFPSINTVGRQGYDNRTTMVVGVEIQFLERPTDNEVHFMRLAAQKLTKDPSTVDISKSDHLSNIVTAIFRMKNEAQYKVVDRVASTFRRMIPFNSEMTIWFKQEKAYDLRSRRTSSSKKLRSPTNQLSRRRKDRGFT